MTTITLDADLARDLIETKLKLLDQEITEIMQKWAVDTVDDLVERARTGSLEEAEDDAIEAQNLRDKRREIAKLLHSL
ncbi:MAG: hypothetical protein ACXAEU_15070 [Candidatus Hodarchaeales archaeon]|jgi:hypothetical protein